MRLAAVTGPAARRWLLPVLMLAGAGLGIAAGTLLGPAWSDPELEPLVLALKAPGTVFLAMLKALAVPLVFISVILGIARVGAAGRFGRALGLTALYFLGTTLIAVITGMLLVELVRPGAGGAVAAPPAEALGGGAQTPARAIYEVLISMFPPNLVRAAAESNLLGLIVFALLCGGVLASMREGARPLLDALGTANELLMRLVRIAVWAAPLGIFGLVADRLGREGGGAAVWSELTRLGWYSATVAAGLLLHGGLTLVLILRLVGRRRARAYAAGMSDALLTAAGTASSAATMAVTLRCAIDNNGVAPEAAEIAVPVGTTLNMDGTALYEAVAVIFLAQLSGIDLTLGQHLLVALTATLAAIGAAAIPEAGLVTMVLVLAAVGLPAENVGLLLAVDWVLDRLRTTVNVWGDSVGAAVIDRFSGVWRAGREAESAA